MPGSPMHYTKEGAPPLCVLRRFFSQFSIRGLDLSKLISPNPKGTHPSAKWRFLIWLHLSIKNSSWPARAEEWSIKTITDLPVITTGRVIPPIAAFLAEIPLQRHLEDSWLWGSWSSVGARQPRLGRDTGLEVLHSRLVLNTKREKNEKSGNGIILVFPKDQSFLWKWTHAMQFQNIKTFAFL